MASNRDGGRTGEMIKGAFSRESCLILKTEKTGEERRKGCGGILQEEAISSEFLRGAGTWHIREI